jgi:hypothetical protein
MMIVNQTLQKESEMTFSHWWRAITAFWTVREKEVLPEPHRSVRREGELQHEQFAYIARLKHEQ